MIKVLFLCIHNSARSQIAEAFLKKFGSNKFIAESAGLETGMLNPLAILVMKEEGIDISGNTTKSVFDFHKAGKAYDYVITVCDKEASDRCPYFPGMKSKINWTFPDPSKFTGTEEEKLQQTREVRDTIKAAVLAFIAEHS
jgi:arsenate reductase (thioredoxin)